MTTQPTHCDRCGTALLAPNEVHRHPRCPRCGIPHARVDLSPDAFPLTIRLFSGKTGEVLWSRTITIDEARGLAKIDVPGYAGTEHYPVRSEITYANGATAVEGLQ
jgi:hypothetical protein